MEKRNDVIGGTAMEAALKKAAEAAHKNKKGNANVNNGNGMSSSTLPDTSGIGVVVVDKVSGPSYEERRKWAEDLGRKEADNKAAKLRLERECKGEIGLLPASEQVAYRAIEVELTKIAAAIAAVDDGLRGHVALASLIRKVELMTKDVQDRGVVAGADMLLRDMVLSKRYRYVTVSEKDALTSKKSATVPSHIVIGHSVIVVPLELTAANKVLSERLMALVKAEKGVFKAREIEKVSMMKARATITLTEVLEGKVPVNGQKSVVYLEAPKKKGLIPNREEGGAPIEIWYPAFQMLLEVKGAKALHILEVNGGPKITETYKDMKKEDRFLLLTFVKSGKITNRIEGEALFKETRKFLADVLRGLENEGAEAQKAAKVSAKDAITAELAEVFDAKEEAVTEKVAAEVIVG